MQKAGNEVLINVQLVDAKTNSHIWAESYTRTLDNIFGVEGEVAGKIATALNAKLSPSQSAELASVPTTDKAAYDLFLRAERMVNQGEVGSAGKFTAAIPLYRQAVEHDPTFALAFARLSYAESVLTSAGVTGNDVAQLRQQARGDAEQAIKLQPDLPAAQLALGYCDYWGDGNDAGALKIFGALLAKYPNNVDALAAQSHVNSRIGHFDAAIASLTRAVALDPRHFRPAEDLADTYTSVGRYADAETWYQRALVLEPDSVNAKLGFSNAILLGSGDISRALVALQGTADALKVQRAWLLSYQRKFSAAIALLASVPNTSDNFGVADAKATQLGIMYWQAGDKTRARRYIAQQLPTIRATLAKAQGLGPANLLVAVGGGDVILGHTKEGLAAIAKSVSMIDASHDALFDQTFRTYDAWVYASANRPDLAVPLLAKALATPGIGASYSPVMLWLDPAWDPIRQSPQFQALLKQYATFKPTVTPVAPPSTSKL